MYAVVDEAMVCHVAFRDGDQPVVLPMVHARVGDALYVHGATGNRLLRSIGGHVVCIAFTLVDVLVLAPSALHHSLDCRSVVAFGPACPVDDPAEKAIGLSAVLDHMAAGRSADARPPSAGELWSTRLVRVDVQEASAKVRAAGVVDEPADLRLAVWAGVVPVEVAAAKPCPSPGVSAPLPACLTPYRRPTASPYVP